MTSRKQEDGFSASSLTKELERTTLLSLISFHANSKFKDVTVLLGSKFRVVHPMEHRRHPWQSPIREPRGAIGRLTRRLLRPHILLVVFEGILPSEVSREDPPCPNSLRHIERLVPHIAQQLQWHSAETNNGETDESMSNTKKGGHFKNPTRCSPVGLCFHSIP